MHSLPAIEGAAPPRLVRAVCLQMLALAGAAVIAALPWPRSQVIDAARPAEPKKAERRIRIVQLPRPRVDRPLPQPAAARPPAPSPPSAAPRPQPSPAPPLARIAADSTAMHGVRMRVLVPRSPGELASHLRNSGGCLVVSRLAGGSAEVLSVLALDGDRVVEMSTVEEEVVLDPFGGSGTTFAVCERKHRRWLGIETESTDVIIERLSGCDLHYHKSEDYAGG